MNGVNIAQVMAVSERRYASMPAELAGCIVLAAADALASAPAEIAPHDLMLFDDGTVRIRGGAPCDEETSERALRQLLDRLLVSACSVTSALLRAARRPSQGRVAAVVSELEIALIPTNRGAAKRSLARLCREVSRALDADKTLRQVVTSSASVEQSDVDALPRPSGEDIQVVVTVPESNDEWIDITPSGPYVHASLIEEIRMTQAASPTVTLDIPDLEVPNGGGSTRELVPTNWQPAECTQELVCYSQHPDSRMGDAPSPKATSDEVPAVCDNAKSTSFSNSEVVELADEDLLEVVDCDSIVNPPAETTDDETSQIATPSAAPSSTTEHLTAEPFPLLVTSTAFGAKVPIAMGGSSRLDTMLVVDVPVLGGQGESDETILDAVACVDEDPRADDSPAECDVAIRAPIAGRHQFVAPARFAKKPSMVSERLAQFRLVDGASADELVDRLRRMAELTQESAFDLSQPPAPPVTDSKNERPESENEGPPAISLGHLDAVGSV